MKKGILVAAAFGLVLLTACADSSNGSLPGENVSSQAVSSVNEESSAASSVSPPTESEAPSVSSEEAVSSENPLASSEASSSQEGVTSTMPADTRLQLGESIVQPDIEATVTSIDQTGSEVCVTMTITNKLNAGHVINMPLQFHLLDDERERLKAGRLEDIAGNDLRGKTIATNETIEAKVFFTLPSGYEPITFQYTYDYMGFRSAQYKIK